MTPSPTKKSSNKNKNLRGCLISGGITIGIFLVAGVGCLSFGLRTAYKYLEPYTSTSPPTLPSYTTTESDLDKLKERIKAFQQPSAPGETTQLTLSADDLNSLISLDDNLKKQVYFKIIDNELVMQGGAPLDRIPGFSGRYLNGTYSLSFSLNEEGLVVTPTDFSLDQGEIPKELHLQLTETLRQENLAKELLRHKQFRQFINNVETISVENDQVIITR